MKKFVIILLLLLLAFLGWLAWHCQGNVDCMKGFFVAPPTPTPTVTFTPTATLKPGVPTRTPTPTPTITRSPTPTYTFTKTFTPTKTNTPTNTFTPSFTPTPTFTFTFTPICTVQAISKPIREVEPNENETEATNLGILQEGGELSAYGSISRVGPGGDHDVYKVDVASPGFYAILDCYTYVAGAPQPGDKDYRINAYDILFRPISLPAPAPGPVQALDLRQVTGKTFYIEVVGVGGRPGWYRLTVKK